MLGHIRDDGGFGACCDQDQHIAGKQDDVEHAPKEDRGQIAQSPIESRALARDREHSGVEAHTDDVHTSSCEFDPNPPRPTPRIEEAKGCGWAQAHNEIRFAMNIFPRRKLRLAYPIPISCADVR
jgi:hypothetical protein